MKAKQLILYVLRLFSVYVMVTCISYVFYILSTVFSDNFSIRQLSGILPTLLTASILWILAPIIAKIICKNDEVQIYISELSERTLIRIMIIGVGLFFAISSLNPIFYQFVTMLVEGIPPLPESEKITAFVRLFGSIIELAVGIVVIAKSDFLSRIILQSSTIRTEQGAAANP